jgi:hypothetical protein
MEDDRTCCRVDSSSIAVGRLTVDLPEEAREAFDYTLVPMHVRVALMEFWDDNESEWANIDLICHWLNIANDYQNTLIARSSLPETGTGHR